MSHRSDHKYISVKTLGAALLAAAFLLSLGHRDALAATLYISPASPQASVGNIVSLRVLVGTNGASINNAEGTIQFPTALLSVLSVSKSSSIFSLWIQEPAFSNSDGTITWNGGLPTPGFTGIGGEVMTITFQAKRAGNASIIFSDGSVRANDGLGTDVLSGQAGATIAISSPGGPELAVPPGAPDAPVITSTTNPDQSRWYNDPNPAFAWVVPSDVTSMRLQYDKNPTAVPGISYSTPITQKTLGNIADGTYYFHAQYKNASGWGAVGNFKFNIDTVPPVPFKITLAQSGNSTDPQPNLNFNTTDALSGMDHYDVKIGDSPFMTISAATVAAGSYTPPTLGPGQKTVVVNAYDKAGNVMTASTDIDIQAIDPPTVDSYPNELQVGDVLRVVGHSYPDATITMTVKDQSGAEDSDVTPTDASGKFAFNWGHKLVSGVYTFRLIVTDKKGATSLPTDPRTVAVSEKLLYRVGNTVIDYFSSVLLVIIVLVVLAAIIIYSYYKLKYLRRKIRRSVANAERAIHQRFKDLEHEMSDHLSKLDSAKSRRQLTREEEGVMALFRKHLDEAEKEIDNNLDRMSGEAE